ncbi:hypothetical protein DCS_00169 [Drechmeria coniospora]|uniref:Swiss Army Knife protein DSP-PTPase phosphatase domain-containing protein n=1 Tax=Drechmeria coniospora TaxID=98403 RepID=A0A151GPW0_DRECN|nr:hypothetical protein DCS_00169 [Drechmeria coniospora]KYK59042.1 hypothetical protein DCS_00169 [Drechmeria coniospora]
MIIRRAFACQVAALLGVAVLVAAQPLPDGESLSEEQAGNGGLQQLRRVRKYMAHTDRLFASSSPNYDGRDSSQRITAGTIEFLRVNGITNVISLNGEANSDHIIRALAAANIAYTPLPVKDFLSPTLHDLARGWASFLRRRNGTIIWCGYGHGRTGTMVTALQMYSQQQRSEFRPWTRDDYLSNFVESESQTHTLDRLQNILQRGSYHEPMDVDEESPSHCRKIKNLEFGLKLADEDGAGTYDKIGAVIAGKSGTATFDIVDDPGRGFQKWVSVDMKSAFGSDTIDIDVISSVKLTAKGTFALFKPTFLMNDKWKVKGVMLRAKCSETGYEAYEDGFVTLDSWFQHTDSWIFGGFSTETVASWQIAPGDWKVTPCETIDKLEYEFKLVDGLFAGTSDSISFTIGEEQGKKIKIGGNVNPGFSRTDTVNLTHVFGSDTVNTHRLNKIRLLDDYGVGEGDKWHFQGLEQQMHMTKFASEDVWLGHDRSKEVVWTGDIAATDWHAKEFIPDPPK